MIKLSIIIPVYNVEDYLDECLSSVFNQDLPFSDYEVIIINDGSKDNSESIILKYQNQFPNIVYVKQENQGVSVARNAGLKIAKGIYISFVDSDDIIHKNSLQPILDRLITANLCMLYVSIDRIDEAGKFINNYPKMTHNNEILSGFEHPRRTFTPTFYKKNILKDILFIPKIVIGEDTVFNTMAQAKAQRCAFLATSYYQYRIRKESASRSIKDEKVFNGIFFAIEAVKNYRNTNFSTPTKLQNDYFDEVLLLFVKRALEWNVLPELNKANFHNLKQLLEKNELHYLIKKAAIDYKNFDKSFYFFLNYHRFKKYFYKIRLMAHKLKMSLKK